MRRTQLALLTLVLLGPLGCDAAPQKTKPTTLPVSGPVGSVHLLAMGDWGRGNDEQKRVAETMAVYSANQPDPIQGCLLAGDNFYVKLSGITDPQWKTVFEDVYDIKRMNFPFLAVLGNHDYEGDKVNIELEYAQKNPQSRWKMAARYYRIDIPTEKPVVSLLMLDSTRDKMPAAQWTEQSKWIEAQLAATPAGVWKITVAHHPLFSNGSHGDIGPLQTDWGPIFKTYGVDVCIAGHDHDLQHLELPGWSETFMLVGGGGAGTRDMRRDNRGPFSQKINGFADLRFTPEKLTVHYIDHSGNELHAFERTKAGEVKVLKVGQIEKATSQPLKAIQGGNPKDD